MTFRVGMKVVCVDASPNRYGQPIFLREGGAYTVVGFSGPDAFGVDGIKLAEQEPPNRMGFRASRFRPAVQPGISFDTSIPADPDSEQYDNRRRIPVSEWGCSA